MSRCAFIACVNMTVVWQHYYLFLFYLFVGRDDSPPQKTNYFIELSEKFFL